MMTQFIDALMCNKPNAPCLHKPNPIHLITNMQNSNKLSELAQLLATIYNSTENPNGPILTFHYEKSFDFYALKRINSGLWALIQLILSLQLMSTMKHHPTAEAIFILDFLK